MSPFTGPRGHDRLIAAITRLQRLADDLTRIAGDDLPSPDELENAPILDGYSVAETRLQCLVGHQTGHPDADGKLVRTSELYLFAPEQGWARTMSRYYRLGRASRGLRRA